MAFLFERLMALWVFMATMLTSTVLVPIFVALYWKGAKTSVAGLSSCVVGLASVIVYYAVIQQLGTANDIYELILAAFAAEPNVEFAYPTYRMFRGPEATADLPGGLMPGDAKEAPPKPNDEEQQ